MNCIFLRRGYGESGPKFSDTFSENDWETIILACQGNAVPDTWAVGDQKAMTINGKDYLIDVIGKNHDTYSSGGTAPLTFQFHDCYGTSYAMNTTATTAGGWESTVMRSTHLPSILELMPTEVKAAIREVNKLSGKGGSSTTIQTTADKLFLLSMVEFTNSNTGVASGEGSRYEYYTSRSAGKTQNGSSVNHLTRSPAIAASYAGLYFRTMTASSTGYAYANKAFAFAPAFCF